MKRISFRVFVALLTLIMVSVNVEAYGQLSKKEQKQLKREQKQAALTELIEQYRPSTATFTFDSEPQGAKVIVDGKVIGITPVTAKIPVPNELPNIAYATTKTRVSKTIESNTFNVTFLKDGYQQGVEMVKPDVDISFFAFSWPDGVFHILKPSEKGATNPDASIPAGEDNNAVSRDNPGQTALERTIIRWYFESAPQGARIFWRVISSVPDQVKNTNENWLGNTPFEETRSFNIQGLTYENSRDVQIEIKVRRPGYLDQTKRFNVRQAIDQQEISSFFDMIKAEE